MSMPIKKKATCSVCGTQSTQTVLLSSNEYGSPDLDLRPPEMLRSTMEYWLQECPSCGYVADSLSEACPVPASFLQSTSYRTCDDAWFHTLYAPRFYRSYLIHTQSGAWKRSMQSALETAWLCDDAMDTVNAVRCRNLAAASMEHLLREDPHNETLLLKQLDILRRAGRFDEAIAAYEKIKQYPVEEFVLKLAAFEAEKARQHDTGCYTIADAQE